MALIKKIGQSLSGADTPAPGTPTDNTRGLEALLSARSGKVAGPSAGPKTTTLSEQGVNLATQQQGQQAQQQGALQAIQLEQQAESVAQGAEIQKEVIDENRVAQQEQYTNQLKDLLQGFEQQGEQLNLKKNQAKLEQTGFLMRLSDDKYTTNLQMNGQRDRLNNAASFKEQLMRTTFADELDLFQDDLDFRTMLKADDRKFQEMLAKMDINTAIQLASAKNEAASATQMWTGVGEIIKAGATLVPKIADALDTKKPVQDKPGYSGQRDID